MVVEERIPRVAVSAAAAVEKGTHSLLGPVPVRVRVPVLAETWSGTVAEGHRKDSGGIRAGQPFGILLLLLRAGMA